MLEKLISNLQLMQSLLAPVQLEKTCTSVSDRIQALELARRQLHERLPVMISSARQQRALDILRNQACMEFFYNRRCESIRNSELDPLHKQGLVMDLTVRYQQAKERMQAEWPALESHEADILPLLLMRQSIEEDIEKQLSSLRQQMYFPAIA